MWLPLGRTPLGTWPATQVCALTGNRTYDPLVLRTALSPLNHTPPTAPHPHVQLCSVSQLLSGKSRAPRRGAKRSHGPAVANGKRARPEAVPARRGGLLSLQTPRALGGRETWYRECALQDASRYPSFGVLDAVVTTPCLPHTASFSPHTPHFFRDS